MSVQILIGDCLERLREMPSESVHCVVTSPPYYGLRCYGVDGQIGLEPTPDEHITKLVEVFREVRRVLRKDGTLWLNYGDAYAGGGRGGNPDESPHRKQATNAGSLVSPTPLAATGAKAKDLLMMPARVALALQADGWWLRSEIIWAKPNPMPESVTDRPTSSHEKIYLLAKSARYFYDAEAVRTPSNGFTKTPDGWDTSPGAHGTIHRNGREKGKRTDKQRGHSRRHAGFNDRWDAMSKEEQCNGANLRNVWTIPTKGYSEAHFATFPPALVEPCIKAGTSEKGVCAECGAPWARDVGEGTEPKDSFRNAGGYRDHANEPGYQGRRDKAKGKTGGPTIGWSPACACKAAVVPATVLDPFGGAGTVGLVADRLSRSAILIELNPEYAAMAKQRIQQDAGMFGNVLEGSLPMG